MGTPIDFISKVDGHVYEECLQARDELIRLKQEYLVISMKQTQKGTVVRFIENEAKEHNIGQKVDSNLEDAYIYHLENLRKEMKDGR